MTAPDRMFAAAPAFSRPLMLGVMMIVIAESVAVHALLYPRWPWLSLVLLVLNVWTIWWLYREGTAQSSTAIHGATIEVRHGRSTRADIPLAIVRDVRVPAWQQVPQVGDAGYHALSAGDDPNVLLTLDPPASLRMVLGLRRRVTVLGLRLTEPREFVEAVQRERDAMERG